TLLSVQSRSSRVWKVHNATGIPDLLVEGRAARLLRDSTRRPRSSGLPSCAATKRAAKAPVAILRIDRKRMMDQAEAWSHLLLGLSVGTVVYVAVFGTHW